MIKQKYVVAGCSMTYDYLSLSGAVYWFGVRTVLLCCKYRYVNSTESWRRGRGRGKFLATLNSHSESGFAIERATFHRSILLLIILYIYYRNYIPSYSQWNPLLLLLPPNHHPRNNNPAVLPTTTPTKRSWRIWTW